MGEPHRRAVLLDVGARAPDAATIAAVARLHLEAHRIGEQVVLVGASDDLRALLELCGLTEVLRLEVGG